MIKARHLGTVIGGAALAAGLLGTGTVHAAAPSVPHTVTFTQTAHRSFTDDQAFNPCTGDPIVLQLDGNEVEHVTFFPASDEVWATFTETGAILGTDDGTDVTYSGHATAWGNFNLNERNGNSEFTLTIHATGSDGSSITAHETTVFAMNANGGVTVDFDKASLTCG